MQVFEMREANLPETARLMARIKPDWWDYQGGLDQLSNIGASARNVGWILGDDERRPRGWLLCMELDGYSCLSIECLGYDQDGAFVMERPLLPLIERAEAHARAKGYRMLRYMISSVGMSCDGQDLGDCWQALRDLAPHGRAHYEFFVDCGFRPTGFLPNCYGVGCHAIVMVKPLV